jgi:hypothetical protein
MVNKKRFLTTFLVVFVMLLVAVGCKVNETTSPTPTPPAPAPSDTPESLFNTSGHADASAEAFIHWDEDDPPVVPTGCAKCHSVGGFLDFLHDGIVGAPAEPGAFNCDLCHTDSSSGATRDVTAVTFPSGNTIGGLGPEAMCMQCHQGRSSKPTVDAYLATRGGATPDVVNGSISFRNIHYFAAAATLYGTHALGGYQYPGMTYDGKNIHVEGVDGCTSCHNPHSLEVMVDSCTPCHSGVSASGVTIASSGLKNIRHYGSHVDYDGDGNTAEGIYWELVTLSEYLYNLIWKYSKDVGGVPVVYESHTYPYFFYDNNENGVADPEEANYGNQYRKWTPRLLKAAYNYQVYLKDPGGYAHGGKYMIQLLYDSLMDLNSAAPNPMTLPGLARNDEGHFDGSSEAWRHWDADGSVPGRCAKCHGYGGLAYFVENGENVDTPVGNGMLCTTCHADQPANGNNLITQDSVTFPSGAVLSLDDGVSNLCLNCHQGRASKIQVDEKIGSSAGNYSFTNIHYFPTAAVLYGTEAQGGYEYERKTYAGRKMFYAHGGDFDSCVECHMGSKGQDYAIGHNVQKPNPADCVICHGRDVSQPYPGWDPAMFKFDYIRPASTPDYDGDGNTSESIKMEIKGLEEALYAQLKLESRRVGAPLVYDSHAYPYFFKDTNGNGIADPGEANYGNQYRFTKELLKAAYNYQVSKKEPNGFIHNSLYIAQLLVDSIEDIQGDVSPYTWR